MPTNIRLFLYPVSITHQGIFYTQMGISACKSYCTTIVAAVHRVLFPSFVPSLTVLPLSAFAQT